MLGDGGVEAEEMDNSDATMWNERRSRMEMLKLIDIVEENTNIELENSAQRRNDDNDAIKVIEDDDETDKYWYLCGDLFIRQTKAEVTKSLHVDKWVMEDVMSNMNERKKRLEGRRSEILKKCTLIKKIF
eukprot:gnl/Chilomastix_caulleri/3990.p1 GENE.gnl/Chilomastix_caulleri/3990~~gnl/Chilomastix_caulleri/3990.p1  ORF type:complete len:130 (-),score=32.34 gnl/Chilomastix_caulleri/3990:179-568(-)